MVRLRPSAQLSSLRFAARWSADGPADPVQAMAAAFPARGSTLARPAARQAERNSLWHRARHRRADHLSADRMDQGDRPRSPRDALIRAANVSLRQFQHASLTML